MSSALPMDCRKAISRWCRQGLYVYLRPVSSVWVDPTNPHTVYWNVLVEYRNVDWKQWRAEGKNLADCIRELQEQIPRNIKGASKPSGYMTPSKAIKKAEPKKKRKKKRRGD